MKQLIYFAGGLFTLLAITFTACHKDPEPIPMAPVKIGLVGGLGSFSDAGFNQNILAGFQQAARDFSLVSEARESASAADFAPNISYFVNNDFDLIITAGFDAAQATLAAANANPSVRFLLLDYAAANPPANLLCAVFDVDQSSFPCGFLAAYWANRQNALNPVAGFVGGPEIPEIRQFSVSYSHGIAYFNAKYHAQVTCPGYYATSFTDSLQGVRLADSLMQQNASVIFAFAGSTGNGTLYRVKEAGKWAIGVDVDQYLSIPAVGPVLLTSCMKKLDVMVYDIVQGFVQSVFPGGTIVHGNLGNQGVNMAPFHSFEALIPDSIKNELNQIKTGISAGTIATGWPE